MKAKKLIALLLAVLMAAGIFAVSASAYTSPSSNYKGKSTYTPVSVLNHEALSAVTLYGNADYICMKAKSDSSTDIFVLELFSDAGCKKRMMYYENNFTSGKTSYVDTAIKLVGLKSGTYYAKSYVKKSLYSTYPNNNVTDPSTIVKFKLSIKRGGTTVKNMNTVMCGYENTKNGPKLYWFSVPGAKGYYLYRYDSGKYVKIATVKAGSGNYAFYVDKAYKNTNGSKTYKVAAYDGNAASAKSINNCQALMLKTPTVKACVAGDNQIEISWTSCGNNINYTVFRRTKDSEWEKVCTTKDCSYAEEFPSENTLYYYTVVASTDDRVSGYNENGVPVLTLKAPKLKACTHTETGINVQWDAVNGANKYRVYRKTSLQDCWTRIAEVTSTSFYDQNVQKDGRYYYTVQSVYNGFVGSYKKDGTGGAFLDAPVLNDIRTNRYGCPIVSWSPVSSADHYNVYRKTAGGDWSLLNTVWDTEYDDRADNWADNLEPAETYTYTVKAVWYDLMSGCDETGKATQYFPVISDLRLGYTANSDPNAISLLWEASPIAEKYDIYRKTADTDYKLIAQTDTASLSGTTTTASFSGTTTTASFSGTTATASFSDTTAEEGVKYTYKVVYTYKGAEIASAGAEIAAKKSASPKKIVDQPYTAHAFKDAKGKLTGEAEYSVSLENADWGSSYWVFRKVDGKWCYVTWGQGYVSLNNINLTDPSEEFAVVEITSDGEISKLPETGTTFYFNTTVTNLASSVDQMEHTLTLRWDAVENCDGYAIYKDNIFVEITKEPQYFETGIEDTGNNTYTVCAIKGNDTLAGKQINVAYVGIPTLVAENVYNGVQVTINRDALHKAEFYTLYRRTEGTTEWTKIATLDVCEYLDTNVKSGVTYYYAVSANDQGVESEHEKIGIKHEYLEQPRITAAALSLTIGMDVSWNAIDGATSYVVYRRSRGSSWQVIAITGSDSTGIIDTAVSGESYYYAVQAADGDTRSCYACTQEVCYLLSPELYFAKATGSGITVSFSPVKGAEGYIVYRKTAGKSWSRIATLKSASAKSYLDKSAKKGVKYTYTVRAYHGSDKSGYNVSGVSAKI